MEIRVGSTVMARDNNTWSSEFVEKVIKPRIEFVVSNVHELRLGGEPRTKYRCIAPALLFDYLGCDTLMLWDDEVELARPPCPMGQKAKEPGF